MMAKILWALFPEKMVGVNVLESSPPLKNDDFLSVPRYVKDAQRFESTQQFVDFHLGRNIHAEKRNYRNTLYWAKAVIAFLGVGCFFLGIVGGIYLLVMRFN
jgi:hypothetical protein